MGCSRRIAANVRSDRAQSNTLLAHFQDMKPQVRRVTALFLLCQVFLILTHRPLVRVLAWIILAGGTDVFTASGAARISRFTANTKVILLSSSGCMVGRRHITTANCLRTSLNNLRNALCLAARLRMPSFLSALRFHVRRRCG